ncbi:MAG: hypothetical protein WC028_24500 [Candidatus Obscuribacterales bacterium]|jgi:hypothetical protein
MSNNRKFAIVILVVWVAILIALPAWAMSDTFSTFYQEGLSKGLAGYQSVFYALKLSGAAAGWIKVPLILGNLPVALLFKYLWKRPAA